jgi:hypothetical protein
MTPWRLMYRRIATCLCKLPACSNDGTSDSGEVHSPQSKVSNILIPRFRLQGSRSEKRCGMWELPLFSYQPVSNKISESVLGSACS